jgi:hypothetical protein
MTRRALGYLALIVTSVVVSACSQPTGPRRGDTITCDGITIIVASGMTCDSQ